MLFWAVSGISAQVHSSPGFAHRSDITVDDIQSMKVHQAAARLGKLLRM